MIASDHPLSPTHAARSRPDAPLRIASGATDDAQAQRREPALPLVWRAACLFALAIAVRAWIVAQPWLGHDEDLVLFTRWIRGITDRGIGGFFKGEGFCDYPPLMLLLFRGVGAASDAIVGGTAGEYALRIGIKSLACLADLATGVLLLIEGRRWLGSRAALVAAALYLLNPVAIYDSAYWGQVDAIYTTLILLALMFVGRHLWGIAGLAAAVSLTAKFQAIAVVPIFVFEAFRIAGLRGLGRMLAGAVIGLAVVLSPFAMKDVLREVINRSYFNVIGQYHTISSNAYNLWYAFGVAEAADIAPPADVVQVAAAGRDSVDITESPLLKLTWRRISLVIFSLAVAIVVSLYSLRPGPIARFGAAGLLALCFFLFPTEMHERYAFPAVALLAVWAAARAWNERLYWALTILLALNIAAVLSPAALAPLIGGANLLVFALIAAGIVLARRGPDRMRLNMPDHEHGQLQPDDRSGGAAGTESAALAPVAASLPVWRRRVIRTFQFATLGALIVVVAGATWVQLEARRTPPPDRSDVVWLESLKPEFTEQSWRAPARGRAVTGGVMQIGQTLYLRGVGTHAPAKLLYRVPAGCRTFKAIAGIDEAGGDRGSASVVVKLDGVETALTGLLTSRTGPREIEILVEGARLISFEISSTEDGRRSDHVNLALARFERAAPEPDSATQPVQE